MQGANKVPCKVSTEFEIKAEVRCWGIKGMQMFQRASTLLTITKNMSSLPIELNTAKTDVLVYDIPEMESEEDLKQIQCNAGANQQKIVDEVNARLAAAKAHSERM